MAIPMANGAVQRHSGRLVHRQLVPVRGPGGSNGGEVLELEQVGARVAALVVVLVALHLHPLEQHLLHRLHGHPAAVDHRRRRQGLRVAVQEPHGPLRLPARRRRLAQAGAGVGRRRRARGLRPGRRRGRRGRRALAGEDGVEEAREARAGGSRLAEVPELGAYGGPGLLGLLLRRGPRRTTGDSRADGAEASVVRRLRLGRREPAVARTLRRARRRGVRTRRARPVAPRERRLVVVPIVQGRLVLLLGRRSHRLHPGGAAAVTRLLVHRLVYRVEQRGRERRLVGDVPPRRTSRHLGRRPPLHRKQTPRRESSNQCLCEMAAAAAEPVAWYAVSWWYVLGKGGGEKGERGRDRAEDIAVEGEAWVVETGVWRPANSVWACG